MNTLSSTPSAAPVDALLQVRDLRVEFLTRAGTVHAVNGISFDIPAGETLALVGESGSGKSATALALMGLIGPPGHIAGGEVRFDGQDLLRLPYKALSSIRGRDIAMVFQDPMSALNPLLTIGAQIDEVLAQHTDLPRRARRDRTTELLAQVGLPKPSERLGRLPHEFSGGQRQRIMIAMALACEPRLLIADEPTTALDVTIQAQILDLLAELKSRMGLAMLLVTHDLGVVAQVADRVAVMYAGGLVETGDADQLFQRPAHPYTAGLLRATPRLDDRLQRMIAIPGAPPDMRDPPQGCAFRARCPAAYAACMEPVRLHDVGAGRAVACQRPFTPAWEAA